MIERGREVYYSVRLEIPKATMIELERARKDAGAPEDAVINITGQSVTTYSANSITISNQPTYVTFTWVSYV